MLKDMLWNRFALNLGEIQTFRFWKQTPHGKHEGVRCHKRRKPAEQTKTERGDRWGEMNGNISPLPWRLRFRFGFNTNIACIYAKACIERMKHIFKVLHQMKGIITTLVNWIDYCTAEFFKTPHQCQERFHSGRCHFIITIRESKSANW